ncbi:hypothetical protein [Pseudonocardia sp. HH130630-07]|uniref:hypothetical protein n=1 Tax=Pseudonocardia sp. HH130630-07 TaxID=1690815 RepID=UPI0008151114|nr:hypothetical protein [Pseudonocardia sp. HH130630-07]ANY08964.1 hypothetical protein AFB00_24880 [Pseudonocardia sp. HH130630-07]
MIEAEHGDRLYKTDPPMDDLGDGATIGSPVIDPHNEAVLVHNPSKNVFEDKTADISSYTIDPPHARIHITYRSGRTYAFRQNRVRILGCAGVRPLTEDTVVEVSGTVWSSAVRVADFGPPGFPWTRVFYRKGGREGHALFPTDRVRTVRCATSDQGALDVLRHWRSVASALPADDPLKKQFARMTFVHPESALGAYLTGAPIASRAAERAPIFPFRCNLRACLRRVGVSALDASGCGPSWRSGSA